jgi:predicted CopG family antitoxin
MTQQVPDFSTLIITISFLLVLGLIAFVIKKKSGHIKNIIKKENNLEIINQLPMSNGFFAYIFKVGNENFFFVGHKSGRGSFTQIDNLELNKKNKNNHIFNKLPTKSNSQQNKFISEQPKNTKPLQHVNISDLLTAHKKGKRDV